MSTKLLQSVADSNNLYYIEHTMLSIGPHSMDSEKAPIITSILKNCIISFRAFLATMTTLSRLSYDDTEPFAEAIPIIVSALGKWYKDADFCRTALKVLRALAGPNDWRLSAEAGGIPLYIAILEPHINSTSICEQACFGLKAMLIAPHPDLIVPNYHDLDNIIKANGLQTLLIVLDQHYAHDEVCVNALYILDQIAPHTNLEPVKAELISLLVDFLKYKFENRCIVEHACSILVNNTFMIEKIKHYDDIVNSLINIVEDYLYDAKICKLAVNTLAKLDTTNAQFQHDTQTIRNIFLAVQDQHAYDDTIINPLAKLLHSIANKNFEKHAHFLYPYEHSGYCDICGAHGEKFMACVECDYDECMLCTH